MLTKYDEIQIPDRGDPFINDRLARKKLAENLTRLVQSTRQPFVISLQAPWGAGKTSFIKMWKAHLESFGHTCLYFNAWHNDFVEDPLIAFVGEISKKMIEKKAQGKMGMQLKKLQIIGGKLARNTLPMTIQFATQGLLNQEAVKQASDLIFTNRNEIAGFISDLAEEKIKQYESDKNGILEFKKELADFAKTLSAKANAKKPLVFFVDELDRCKPAFTIALLERIKNVFSVEGVTFVLAINRAQIENSVKSVYGQDTDADGYLRRFVDFSLSLPEPDLEAFCQSLFERFDLQKVFSSRANQVNEQDALLKIFVKLARTYRLSLRVIEQCFTEINLILRTTPSNATIHPGLLSFLVAFKAFKPEAYALLGGSLAHPKIKELLKAIAQDLDMTDNDLVWMLAQFAAYTIYGYLEQEDKVKFAAADINADAECKAYAEPLLQIMQRMEGDYHVVRDLVSMLNLAA
jgi:hypothetical protein